ncbi:MAG: 50S ribosomal protein L32, partial [Actinobacteria bacterium]|nr:50S ribosomal protein L32 [Actinomycetota bacterium]
KNTKRNSFKLNVLSIVECPRCRAKKIAHRVCRACGYYDNKEIIKLEKKSKEKSTEKVKETSSKSGSQSNKNAAGSKQVKKNIKDTKAKNVEIPVNSVDDTSEKAANS